MISKIAYSNIFNIVGGRYVHRQHRNGEINLATLNALAMTFSNLLLTDINHCAEYSPQLDIPQTISKIKTKQIVMDWKIYLRYIVYIGFCEIIISVIKRI